jgi:hypothetical protein
MEEHFSGRFFILKCSNCSRIFFLQKYSSFEGVEWREGPDGDRETEEIEYLDIFPPPPPPTVAPPWLARDNQLDEVLRRLLQEAYKAADAGIFSLAIVGLRAAVEEFARKNGQDPDRDTLPVSIEGLKAAHNINAVEFATLMAVKNGGDAAIHRNFSPRKDLFQTLATPLVDLLQRNAAHADVVAAAADIPARPLRQKTPREPPQG